MNKTALILGITGQDGSYLAERLLREGYNVHGTYRRSSVNNLVRVSHLLSRINLHRADLSDGASIERVIRDVKPNEIYNEADQDHVGFSRETPQVSIDVTAGSVQRLLETVLRQDKHIKVFQPLSATMFSGMEYKEEGLLLDENSHLQPNSPYAVAKLAAWEICKYYRRQGVWVSCGIMFNHESPRRGPNIEFSNLDMKVDIGYAPEYMECAYRFLQQKEPIDCTIGTSKSVTIRQFIEYALDEYIATPIVAYDDYYKEIEGFRDEPTLISCNNTLISTIDYQPTTYGRALIQKLVGGSI